MPELAPDDLIASLRRPRVIYTQDYLNDPIKFEPDARFDIETVVRQEGLLELIERDQADFNIVDMNADTPQFYTVKMSTPVNNRFDVKRIIDTRFRQLEEP